MGRSKFGIEPDLEDIEAARKALDSENIGFLPGDRTKKEKAAIEAANKALRIAQAHRVARDNAAGITSQEITPMRPLRFKLSPGGA